MVGRVVVIDADGEDDHTLIFQARLHADERWRFFNAGRTPRGPEIENDHLSAKLAECDLMIRILNGEIGCG